MRLLALAAALLVSGAAEGRQSFTLEWPEKLPGSGPIELTFEAPTDVVVPRQQSSLDEAHALQRTTFEIGDLKPSQIVTVRATRKGAVLEWRCSESSTICELYVRDTSDPPPARDAASAWCGKKRRLARFVGAVTTGERLALTRDLAASMTQALSGACRGHRCIAPIEQLLEELANEPKVELRTEFPALEGLGVLFDASVAGHRFGVQCREQACEARITVGVDELVVLYLSDTSEHGSGCSRGRPLPGLSMRSGRRPIVQAPLGTVPGWLLPRRGVAIPALGRAMETPWPALTCDRARGSISVEDSDAKLAWRADDGTETVLSARADSHMGTDDVSVVMPSLPQRLQHLVVRSGHPTSLTIDLRCGESSLRWTCAFHEPTCELTRSGSASTVARPPVRSPFGSQYCVSPWDKVPNALARVSNAAPVALAKELPTLRAIATALVDEAHSELEQLCPAGTCASEAEAALPLVRSAAMAAADADLSKLEAGPSFELRQRGALIATVRCQSYNCATYVQLPDGTRYGYAAGMNSLGHARCISEAGFRGNGGEDLGHAGGENDRGVSGRFIRLWRKP